MTVDAARGGPGVPAVPEQGPARPAAEAWRTFRSNRGAMAGLVVIVAIALCALLAPMIAPYSPIDQFRDAFRHPPAWDERGSLRFLLGTDAVGRDMLSRLMHGARISMLIGLMVVTLALFVGVSLGLIAGYFRGWIEIAILRLMDILLALPALLLAIVIVAILGSGLLNTVIAVTIVVLPHYVRLARASVITELTKDYVTAARLSGARPFRLLVVDILPNCMPPLIVQATLGFSTAILDAAALGFLGLGVQPPEPEWGSMLARAQEFQRSAWWIVTFPGLAILVTVLAINLVGDGLRDALDPKLKR